MSYAPCSSVSLVRRGVLRKERLFGVNDRRSVMDVEVEIFGTDDVYIRRVRPEEWMDKRFKGKEFICCGMDGKPFKPYANETRARWDIEARGGNLHTLH